MADAIDVAAAVQSAYGPTPLSWWEIHKLLYFCQGWSLAWTGQPLFRGRIQAWRKGPVTCEVYRVQKYYAEQRGRADLLSPDQLAIVGEVVRFYGGYSAQQLIELTHREPPWRAARVGVAPDAPSTNEITRDSMRAYFASLVDVAKPGHITETARRTVDVLLSLSNVEHPFEDSGVDFDAVLAYLRGQGPDPWPRSESQH